MVKIDITTLAICGGIILAAFAVWWFFIRVPKPNPELFNAAREEVQAQAPPPQQRRPSPALVLFYGDHCPHCHDMLPAWGEVKKAIGSKIDIKELESQNPENGNYVPPKGVPTIRLYPNGVSDQQTFADYSGDRTPESIISFVTGSGSRPQPVQQ